MAALELLGLGDHIDNGFPTDPNQGESMFFYASPGVVVRLTRNVDKDRGDVNGAVGVVRRVLSRDEKDIPTVFAVELSTGVHILVHSSTTRSGASYHAPMAMRPLSGEHRVPPITTAVYGSTTSILRKGATAMWQPADSKANLASIYLVRSVAPTGFLSETRRKLWIRTSSTAARSPHQTMSPMRRKP